MKIGISQRFQIRLIHLELFGNPLTGRNHGMKTYGYGLLNSNWLSRLRDERIRPAAIYTNTTPFKIAKEAV